MALVGEIEKVTAAAKSMIEDINEKINTTETGNRRCLLFFFCFRFKFYNDCEKKKYKKNTVTNTHQLTVMMVGNKLALRVSEPSTPQGRWGQSR